MKDFIEPYLKEAVAYLRYSSHQQDGGVSIEYQMKEIEEYASRNGIKIVDWYIDKAASGKEVAGRDEFIRLFKDVETGETPPNLIVFATSRAFRNSYESHKYRKILREKGVKLLSATQNIDEETSAGRLTTNILSDIDQYKSEEISEYVSAATRLLISEGFYAGGVPPYGYIKQTVIHNGKKRIKLVPHEPEAVIVRELFDSIIAGKNLNQITTSFFERGIVNRNGVPFQWESLKRILFNIVYKGERYYKMKVGNDAYCPNFCEPIVSKEVFDAANKAYEEFKVKIKGRKRVRLYPLTGVCVCQCCGLAYIGAASREWLYYGCGNKYKKKTCTSRKIPKGDLEEMAFNAVKEHILSDKAIEEISQKVLRQIKKAPAAAEDRKMLASQKATLEKEIAEVVRMKLKGTISESVLETMTKDMQAELDLVNRKLSQIEMAIDKTIDAVYIKGKISAMFDRELQFSECTPEMLKELFMQTIEKIEIGNTQVVIHLRIHLFPSKFNSNSGNPSFGLNLVLERKKKRGH